MSLLPGRNGLLLTSIRASHNLSTTVRRETAHQLPKKTIYVI